MHPNDIPSCFNNFMGLWLAEPVWMKNTVSAIKSGIYPEAQTASTLSDLAEEGVEFVSGVAVIRMFGPMMKGSSKFGGVSTVQARRQLRVAAENDDVKRILLVIDSPGGTVSGTNELGQDVQSITQRKPVTAFIEDLGASAAFWVASQTSKIVSNETAEVGSLGVVAVVEDSSEAFERAGVKVHVISTGEFKGAMADGTPITEEMIEEFKGRIMDINDIFMSRVQEGRGIDQKELSKIWDGRVFIAAKALGLGLIDEISTLDATLESLIAEASEEGRRSRLSQLNRRMV